MDKIKKLKNVKAIIKILITFISIALFCAFIVWALQELGSGIAVAHGK